MENRKQELLDAIELLEIIPEYNIEYFFKDELKALKEELEQVNAQIEKQELNQLIAKQSTKKSKSL